MKRQYPLGNYGLTYVLTALFLCSWLIQTWAGWKDFSSEQLTHHETPQWSGDQGYIWHWLGQTMENWQSEFLQLLTFVILTSFLIHKGSHESKDNDDEVSEQLSRIEKMLEELKSRPAS